MDANTPDRPFAAVAADFAAWRELQAAHPLERAWRGLGWDITYGDVGDTGLFGVRDGRAVIIMPRWAEAATPGERGALIGDVRDCWEDDAQPGRYAPYVARLFNALVAVVAEDEGIPLD